MDRQQWYFLQEVDQSDMNRQEDLIEAADRAIVADILGYGFVVSGPYPATVVQNGTPNLKVLANPFLGYDKQGARLNNSRSAYQGGNALGLPPSLVDCATDSLGASTSVSTPGKEKTVAIFAKFARDPSDPRTDGNNTLIKYHQDESVEFIIVQSAEANVGASVPPPYRSDALHLADVVLIFGQTQILNASISQVRQEKFRLSLPHGGTHVEGGSDPVPNATTLVGGLLSSADKTKLDGITFTKAAIGNLFDCQAAPYQPSDITAPNATFLDVTARMVGQAAGGGANKEGVVTQGGAPNNRVALFNQNNDEFLDANGNKVYGRVTVDNETTPTLWTLNFFSYDETTHSETAFDATALGGATIRWFVTKTYRLQNLPTFAQWSGFIPSDQLAGEIPNATTSVYGKVLLAADGEVAAGKAVQANDSRLGGNGNVPIGAVVAWMSVTAGTPLPAAPTGWEYCDGGNVSTPSSPLLAKPKPPLMKTAAQPANTLKILRGHDGTAGSYGGANALVTGGADSHAHATVGHTHTGSLSGASASGTTGAGSAHSHSVPDTSEVGNAGSGGPGMTAQSAPYTGLYPFAGSFTMYSHHHTVPATAAESAHTHPVNVPVSGSVSVNSNTDSTNSQGNIPAFVAMAFIIRVL